MKTILILGASSDIGMAYMKDIEETHKAGEARIIAHFRTMSERLEAIIAGAKRVPVEAVQADLSQPGQVAGMIDFVKAKYTAPTHILHLAAGRFRHMRLRQFDGGLAREEMETQVFSLAEALKAFLPIMAKNRYGRVAVMLSAYTLGIPPKFVADYAICKYALLGLIKAAAAEYCDRGVCINGLSPSMVETKFLGGVGGLVAETSAANSPMKRNMNMTEILAAVRFLMSDENSYMCGTNINVSGGAALV